MFQTAPARITTSLVPQPWNTLNGIFQTKPKARVKLNFFDYSDSKRYYSEPDVAEYEKGSKLQYDSMTSFLVTKP